MESVFARRAFPCFDEPAMKAKFKLTIIRPKQFNSLQIQIGNTHQCPSLNTNMMRNINLQSAYAPKYNNMLSHKGKHRCITYPVCQIFFSPSYLNMPLRTETF